MIEIKKHTYFLFITLLSVLFFNPYSHACIEEQVFIVQKNSSEADMAQFAEYLENNYEFSVTKLEDMTKSKLLYKAKPTDNSSCSYGFGISIDDSKNLIISHFPSITNCSEPLEKVIESYQKEEKMFRQTNLDTQ